MTVGVPDSDRVVRLDIALMDGRGPELALDDDVGGGEACFEVAALELQMARDVGRLVGPPPGCADSGIRIGAPGSIARSTVITGGSTSYSTSISRSASSAICGLVAATAAIAWPSYSTLSRARTFSER